MEDKEFRKKAEAIDWDKTLDFFHGAPPTWHDKWSRWNVEYGLSSDIARYPVPPRYVHWGRGRGLTSIPLRYHDECRVRGLHWCSRSNYEKAAKRRDVAPMPRWYHDEWRRRASEELGVGLRR